MAATPRPSLHLLVLAFSILSLLSLFFFLLFPPSSPPDSPYTHPTPVSSTNVYVAPLPRSLNYGLLHLYWAQSNDARLGADADSRLHASIVGGTQSAEFLPYPENPIVKQYSAEYWILEDLKTPEGLRGSSLARVVGDYRDADVVFVPFFATLSAEMQLGMDKGRFRKREGNMDYQRQRQVVDFVKQTEAWKRSGGRDHVFVLTGGSSP